jgi:hypothetical protein
MKKAKDNDEMRPEYKLSDFKSKGVRGKYYKRIMAEGTNVVLLDRDVQKAFPNSATVNEALRSILRTKRSRRTTPPRGARRRAAA